MIQSAIEETYDDVSLLVHDVTHQFMQKKGMSEYDYDEWHGEACQAFVTSFEDYKPERSKFTTWLHWGVWHSLCDKQRRNNRHERGMSRYKPNSPNQSRRKHRNLENVVDYRGARYTRWEELLESLTKDGNTVVKLVLGTFDCVDETRANPAEYRLGLHHILKSWGWSFSRICEAFQEIKTALLD